MANVTVTQVKAYLGISDERDDEAIQSVIAAVNSLLESWKGDPALWPEHWLQGGVMLASRIYRRRNSPAGVESFGELGGVYIQRNDPDVAQLLGLGVFKRPQVG